MSFTTWLIIELVLIGFFVFGYILYNRRKRN
jgi:hypothetical protein